MHFLPAPLNKQGDITNLLGCILTKQLPFQTLLACYYVLVDAILVLQFFFYKILFPPRPRSLVPTIGANFQSQLQHRGICPQSTSTPVTIHRTAPNRSFQRTVLSIAILLGFVSAVTATPAEDVLDDTDTAEWLGEVFAWICCSLYLSSRLPQILEIHRRKSTQGINIILFLAALCGNSFYTIGILTNPLAHNKLARTDFLLNALPYLLGSAGFDPIIIVRD